MANWIVEPLDRSHERGEFSCGKAPLDNFLRSLVGQYDKRRLGKTYVATLPGDRRVLGYYTLAAGALSFQHLPPTAAKKLPKHPIPVVLLGRLAADQSTRGHGLGRVLMKDALRRTLNLSAQLGIHAVVVEAIDQEARAFYEKFGFLPLPDHELHLYLPLTSIVLPSVPPQR